MFDKFLIFFFSQVEQKISNDVNSRQNSVFCQDAKQNRQIITGTLITCPQQNKTKKTETFNKRHCVIEQRQNIALSMPHTNGIFILFFFFKFSALFDRKACIFHRCSVYLIGQLGGAFLPQAKRWRHVGQHLIHVIVMDTTTGGARQPSNGEEERGKGTGGVRGGDVLRHGWRRGRGQRSGRRQGGKSRGSMEGVEGSERGWRYKREGYSTTSGRTEEKSRRSQSIFFSMRPSGHRNPKSEEKPKSG